ncbi:M23 family peptidase [Treponema phagedenis]|uniref:Uncharacterized protein n=1 Tax=Treponema phagedenis TaxID=162 RepID=A0A0B7GX59_TREPH|nr:peptidoglycan DD-metalloendopeptidase family protein [Treponema phagedenis]EFW37267.1 hypothetical protein HMPREF9554_02277 [Treponema phagedenis F0421]NVP23743.1 peptidoglycan DD-metalloendopeptidase family protein [Treponema phagedenis]QSH95045.1 peptidase M23 [Treponema phagedenis]QSH98984.1 M23 family peptidase [Treponema phagedenis]TYT79304.1 peptidoglycan DD-metalloendopeptidase family protein [Treponema phagedenis]
MRKTFGFFFLITAFTVFSLEWPTDNPTFLYLFGQAQAGKNLEQGIIFDSAQTVRAADHGTRLITIEKKHRLRNFPSTLGNALIFLHEDGLQTVYGNLEDSAAFKNITVSEAGAIIGQTGSSAWGEPGTLIFQVVDTKKKVYINPLLLLPSFNDTVKPTIQNILLERQNTSIALAQNKIIRQGEYKLFASISDMMQVSGKQYAPFRVSISINGADIGTIPFEIITAKEGYAYLAGTKLTGKLLYDKPDRLFLGTVSFMSGKTELAITVRDISGNERTESFLLQVE